MTLNSIQPIPSPATAGTSSTASPYLRRHAQVVRTLALLGAGLLAWQPLTLLLLDPTPEQYGFNSLLGLSNPPNDFAGRLRTTLVSLLPVGGGLYALRQLWRLFGEYGQGRVFGEVAQQTLLRFAWAVLLLALLLPATRCLMSVAASFGNPPGERVLAFGIEWFDGLHILFGAVLLAIAKVMAEARRLADDNAGFI